MRILVVDDHEENRRFLRSLLELKGYEVVEARTGAEALLLLPGPDAVISDILMPTMDGYELCRRIRLDPRVSRLPFAFYTATYTSEEDRDFALGLGADLFLVKPMEPDAFIVEIEGFLAGKGLGGPIANGAPRVGAREPSEGALEETAFLRKHERALREKLEKKVAELEIANAALVRQAERSDALLKELFHRTRNSLQMVSSLLRLYSTGLEDPCARIAQRIELRVEALRLIQDKLYESGTLSEMDLDSYLRDMFIFLYSAHPKDSAEVELSVSIDAPRIGIEMATPLGLVLTELMANSLRHAFRGRAKGRISVAARMAGDNKMELLFSDDGNGEAPRLLPTDGVSGLRIVRELVERQLEGSWLPRDGEGSVFAFRIPLTRLSPGETEIGY